MTPLTHLDDAQADWFVQEVRRCAALGVPLGCCDEWPECSHVLAWCDRRADAQLQDPAKPEPPKVSDPAVSAPPPSVEALEAERDRALKLLADCTVADLKVVEAAEERMVAAEAGRDQAIKERDQLASSAQEALAMLERSACQDVTRPAQKILRSALAGVPGGGQQEQDLGGDRGRSPVVGGEEA